MDIWGAIVWLPTHTLHSTLVDKQRTGLETKDETVKDAKLKDEKQKKKQLIEIFLCFLNKWLTGNRSDLFVQKILLLSCLRKRVWL